MEKARIGGSRKTLTSRERRKGTKKARESFVRGKEDIPPRKYLEVSYAMKVHQTELAQQNKELREMQRKLQESHAQYVDLFDHAPVGYFSFDRNGLILAAKSYRRPAVGG